MLDEPSNFLDREALGGLAVAIKEWSGAVVRMSPIERGLSSSNWFCHSRSSSLTIMNLCHLYVSDMLHRALHCLVTVLSSGPEIWNVDNGRMVQQGKAAIIEDAFLDVKSAKGSGTNTPVRSRLQTPIASTVGTPVASGAEEQGVVKPMIKKKKKLTRNQMKAQEERRRLRKLRWLSEGGPKPEDTDSDDGP